MATVKTATRTRWLDPVWSISLAQLLGTSLWFSANSAADDLMRVWQIDQSGIGWLTSAVQAGFILGTLFISLTGLADRYRASSIFVSCAVFGALFNAAFAWLSGSLATAAVFRFGVGLSLAGVYPMGMKLVVSWAPQRTGTALALLVGMLTLGTALPHALKGLGAGLPWQQTIVASSVLALVGAIIIFRLGDGPHLRRISSSSAAKGATAAKPHRRTPHVLHAFRSELFRATALGYWGHMWELYTFWTLVPLLVVQTLQGLGPAFQTGSLPAFCIIAAGALGCVLGGRLSRRFGSNRVAAVALALSAGCCVVFASGYDSLPAWALFGLLLLWGAAVVADSPQFSALAAAYCPRDAVGSALAIMNSLGYAITIMSIALTSWLIQQYGLDALWVLVPGPVLGLLGFARVWARNCAA